METRQKVKVSKEKLFISEYLVQNLNNFHNISAHSNKFDERLWA